MFCHGLDKMDVSAFAHRPIDVFVLESINSVFFSRFFTCFILEVFSIGINESFPLF